MVRSFPSTNFDKSFPPTKSAYWAVMVPAIGIFPRCAAKNRDRQCGRGQKWGGGRHFIFGNA